MTLIEIIVLVLIGALVEFAVIHHFFIKGSIYLVKYSYSAFGSKRDGVFAVKARYANLAENKALEGIKKHLNKRLVKPESLKILSINRL